MIQIFECQVNEDTACQFKGAAVAQWLAHLSASFVVMSLIDIEAKVLDIRQFSQGIVGVY